MATRKEYIEKLAAKLHEWDARIDELRGKAERSSADVRESFKSRISELREKREKASVLLDELHEAGDDAWKGVKEKVDRLYEEVKNVFKKAA